ncbi:hypothetical protein Pan189_23220 [Stratiformator vulcanicus]|uniref:Uncharacterized protein n=1 Tax=Stratiformator vulcanicus TaxID=2527980 RepID=A0A517R227_9PLAN|nr:hypothetical protein Pan189_23220 [Stratiformator vulcanicus]
MARGLSFHRRFQARSATAVTARQRKTRSGFASGKQRSLEEAPRELDYHRALSRTLRVDPQFIDHATNTGLHPEQRFRQESLPF